jgi:acyl-coenzyme A thioesterase PaaI-like protein
MKTLPHTRSCFVCGEHNPIGLRLRFETDGREVCARFTPKAEHAGFRETIHGGLIATVLDEIMVWACAVQTRRFAYCAELTVRYLQPVRPGVEIVLMAELVENRRGRIFDAKAEIHDPSGAVLASAVGKYLPLKDAVLAEQAVDFVGDVEWLLRPAG